jgi:hypothetical protein
MFAFQGERSPELGRSNFQRCHEINGNQSFSFSGPRAAETSEHLIFQ